MFSNLEKSKTKETNFVEAMKSRRVESCEGLLIKV